MLCVPWMSEEIWHCASIWPETLVRVTVAHSVVLVVLSVKVTVPVGSTLVPTGLTVAVKVTCCPSSEGLPEVPRPTVTPALFTVTVLLQVVPVGSLSVISPPGSIWHFPPERGLRYGPAAVGLTGITTVKTPLVAPMVTEPPLAVQVRVLLVMPQLMLGPPVMLVWLPAGSVTVPKVSPLVGRSSCRI